MILMICLTKILLTFGPYRQRKLRPLYPTLEGTTAAIYGAITVSAMITLLYKTVF